MWILKKTIQRITPECFQYVTDVLIRDWNWDGKLNIYLLTHTRLSQDPCSTSFLMTFSVSGLVRSLCGYPGAPAHSSVQFSPGQGGEEGQALEPGTIAEYSCDRGFELLGPARRVCGDNGTWSPQGIPFCGE